MTDRLARTAEELRRAFDASFTAAAPEPSLEIAFLAIRVGTEPFAVRLLDTAGLVPARKITRVPSADPALLGIAGLRGAMVPVYSLGALLGRRGVTEDAPWRLACGREPNRIALAFTRFEAHLRAAPSAVRTAGGERRGHELLAEVLSVGGEVRPVIDVRSLLASITGDGGVGP